VADDGASSDGNGAEIFGSEGAQKLWFARITGAAACRNPLWTLRRAV
jgi:hypothetical protein